LPREGYDDRAFDDFDTGADGFVLANARAMAWAAQLAYETETPDKMRDVAAAWGFGALEPLIAQLDARGLLTVTDTRGFIAAGAQATIVGFSGTDPPVLANWITNFDAAMTPHGRERIHAGFLRATLAVRPLLESALRRLHTNGRPLYVVGHSLGAALAVVAARLIASEGPLSVSGVYAFGMPRTGDEAFSEACGALLGSRIYRLVHGDDIVPGVPFGLLGYCHVGRYLRCPSGGSFTAAELTPGWSSNEPNLGRDAIDRLRDELARSPSWQWPPASLDPRDILVKALIGALPRQIRDHLPDQYIAACAAPR
jgi:triacylglycerol lipase